MLHSPTKWVKKMVRLNWDENIIDGTSSPRVMTVPTLASGTVAVLDLVANWTNMDLRTLSEKNHQPVTEFQGTWQMLADNADSMHVRV